MEFAGFFGCSIKRSGYHQSIGGSRYMAETLLAENSFAQEKTDIRSMTIRKFWHFHLEISQQHVLAAVRSTVPYHEPPWVNSIRQKHS